jgi:hypothetical protein
MKIKFIIEEIIQKNNIFKGAKLQNDLAKGTIYLLTSDERIIMQYECYSGGWGDGPLELGEYKVISLMKDEELKKMNTYNSYSLFDFGWFARLEPKFETKRTDLGMHPDGNIIGSLGCPVIPFENLEDNKKMFELIEDELKTKNINFLVMQILNRR